MKLWKYFKDRKGFDRLFKELRNKYVSLGRFSGSVIIKNVNETESEDLSDFFGIRVIQGEDFKTSFSKMEKILRMSKYSDFTWEDLFLGYFEEKLIDKKSVKILEQDKIKEFFDGVIIKVEGDYRKLLNEVLLEKENIYQIMLKRYHKNSKSFENDLVNIFRILSNLDSAVPTSLSILSSISGNPHFLDFGTQNSSLFIKLMAKLYKEKEPMTRMDKIDFLSHYGIYVDSYSNYAVTYLLKSDKDFVNGFAKDREVLNLNLSNLDAINVLDTDKKCVFVFENPSMLAALKDLDVPIVISSGNPNYVVYKILEKLIDSNNCIYYNGDFDPEGLDIAYNLKNKFKNINLFCYKEEDFYNCKSNNIISNHRLKRLEKINDDGLLVVKNLLINEKYSGYQEKNINRIKDFICD